MKTRISLKKEPMKPHYYSMRIKKVRKLLMWCSSERNISEEGGDGLLIFGKSRFGNNKLD